MSKTVKEIIVSVTDKGSLKITTKEVDKLNASLDRAGNAHRKAGKGAQEHDRNMKGASKQSSNSTKNFSKMAQGMQSVLVPAYAEVAARVFAVTAAYNALKRAADFSILVKGQSAYAKLTGKNMGSIAKKIQAASGHMIDFADASRSAALASTAGLATDQIVKMTEAARAASVALGRDMNDSMDRLTRGIVKAEPEILDELGIIIRLDRVYKDYAESLDKTTAELTEYEKLQASVNTILAQTDSKFGDIAKTVPANEFAKLGAAVLDLTHRGSALISEVLGPLASALSESKVLLGLLMALILKNVIGKALPALKGLGKAFKELPEKMAGGIGKVEKKIAALQKRTEELKQKKDVTPKATEKALRETLGKLKIKKNSKLAEALGKSISGDEFRNEIKKSITSAVGVANAKLKGGQAVGGMFTGQPELLDVVTKQFKQFNKSLKDSSRSMRSLVGIDFLSWITGATLGAGRAASSFLDAAHGLVEFNLGLFDISKREGVMPAIGEGIQALKAPLGDILGEWSNLSSGVGKFGKKASSALNKVYISIKTIGRLGGKSIMLLTKAFTGLATILMSKVIASLNMVTFAIGTLTTLQWLAGMIFDLSDNMGKARDAADSLVDSLEDLTDRLQGNTKIFTDFSSSLVNAVKASEFKTNIAEEYSNAVAEALILINTEEIAKDFWSGLLDSLYDVFGSGLDDKLGESVAKAIQLGLLKGDKVTKGVESSLLKILGKSLTEEGKLADTDYPFLKELKGPLSISDSEIELIFSKMRKGVALTSEEVSNFVNLLETTGKTKELRDLLQHMADSAKILAEESKKASTSLSELIDKSTSYEKSRKDFVKSLVKGSDFKELATSFQGLTNIFNSEDITNAEKVLQLFESDLLTDEKAPKATAFKNALANLKEQESILREQKKLGRLSTEEIKELENNVADAAKETEKLGSRLWDILTQDFAGTENLLVALFGGDPIKANDDAITLATTINNLNRKKDKYAKFGIVTLKEQNKLERDILEKQKEQLENKLTVAKPDDLTPAGRESLSGLIDEYNAKIEDTYKINEKLSESFHKVKDTVYLLSDLLKDKEKDISFDEWEQLIPAAEDWGFQDVTKEVNILRHSLDPLFKETQEFSRISDFVTLGLEKGIIKSRTAADALLETWKKLNTEFGRFQAKLGIDQLKEEMSLSQSGQQLQLAKSGIESDSVEAKLADLRHQQATDIKVMSAQMENQEHSEKEITKWVQEQEKHNENIYRLKQLQYKDLRKTAKITGINSRLKAIKGERANLRLQREFHAETAPLLEFRQQVAELEREYGKEGVDNELRKLEIKEIALSYEQLMNDLATARREERKQELEDVAQAYKNIADAFGSTISSAVSDFAMGKETDWRTALAQTFADASGNIIGGMVKRSIFGREGLIGKLVPDNLKDTILGPEKDSAKISRDMQSLTEMARSRGLAVRVVNNPEQGNTYTLGKEYGQATIETAKILKDQVGPHSFDVYDKTLENTLIDKLGEVAKGDDESANKILAELAALKAQKETESTLPAKQDISKFYKIGDPYADDVLMQFGEKVFGIFNQINNFLDKHSKFLNQISPISNAYGFEEGGWFGKDSGTPSELLERGIVRKNEGKIPLFRGRSGIHGINPSLETWQEEGGLSGRRDKSLYEFRSEQQGLKMYQMPERLPESFFKLNPGIFPEGTKPGQIIEHDVDDIQFQQLSVLQQILMGISSPAEASDTFPGLTGYGVESIQGPYSPRYIDENLTGGGSLDNLNELSETLGEHLSALSTNPSAFDNFGPGEAYRHMMAAGTMSDRYHPWIARTLGGLNEVGDIGGSGFSTNDLALNELGIAIQENTTSIVALHNKILDLISASAFQNSGDPVTFSDRMRYREGGADVQAIIKEFRAIWTPQLEKLEQGIITELPSREKAERAYEAMLKGATPGSFFVHDIKTENAVKNSDGTNTKIIRESMVNDLNIKDDVKGTLKSGFGDVIRNGHIDAENLASSFLGSMASKAATKATDFVFAGLEELFFAKGGIAEGGFRAFASGGTVSRPTLGLVGEGKYNEAVVPLPDGKSIPVIGNAGGGDNTNNITINVNVDQDGNAQTETKQEGGGMDGEAAQQLGYMVSQAVQAELVEQQRPGGILSRYG